MEVLWLKSKGLTHADIATLANASPRSVQRYLDEFQRGGLDLLRRVPWRGKRDELDDHRATLEDHFLKHPPRSTREAQWVIAEVTSIGATCDAFFSSSALRPGCARRLWLTSAHSRPTAASSVGTAQRASV
jgi:transposase